MLGKIGSNNRAHRREVRDELQGRGEPYGYVTFPRVGDDEHVGGSLIVGQLAVRPVTEEEHVRILPAQFFYMV